MSNLEHWTLSASSLQTYSDCPWKFHLSYIQKLRWPTPVNEKTRIQEERVERGRRFHRLLQQHVVGVPRQRLDEQAERLRLDDWWHAFNQHDPLLDLLNSELMPEVTLIAPVGDGYRLQARYDLLSWDGSYLRIFDWKTNRRRPTTARISQQMQSLVYRAVAALAGANVVGSMVSPDQVEMTYWFTSAPHDPEVLTYSSSMHEAILDRLHELLTEINSAEEVDFVPTTDDRTCSYCRYLTYCQKTAAPFDPGERFDDEGESLEDFDLNMDQIAEIAF